MPAGFISRVMNEVENCRYVKLEEAPTTIKISALLNGIEDPTNAPASSAGWAGCTSTRSCRGARSAS
jgi:hypothetical protein